jgi:hypothetical protein
MELKRTFSRSQVDRLGQRLRGLAPWQRSLLPLLGILLLGVSFPAGGAFFRWQTHAALLRYCGRFPSLASWRAE